MAVIPLIYPIAPRQFFASRYTPWITGKTLRVSSGGDLQAAFNLALPGDEILLEPGGTYTGNFTLPAKLDMTPLTSNWIVVRPDTPSSLLPLDARVRPSRDRGKLPKLVSPQGLPVIEAMPGAAGWYFEGLEFTLATDSRYPGQELVRLGQGKDIRYDSIPGRFVLRQVWVHGNPGQGVKKGILANCSSIALLDSVVNEIHMVGQETHAFGSWAGPGPFYIDNCHLSAAGIGVLFGGADPLIYGLTPSDCTIRRTHVHKPDEWKSTTYTVKNAIEAKHVQRWLVLESVLDGTWPRNQAGWLMQLTAVSDNNTAPWTKVHDVAVRSCIFRRGSGGVNISSRAVYPNRDGSPGVLPDQPSRRILFDNNVFYRLDELGGQRKLFQLSGDLENVTLRRNTGEDEAAFMVLSGSDALPKPYMTGLVAEDNLFGHGKYGLFGDGDGFGTSALAKFAPDAVFQRNGIYGGGLAKQYPANNYFAATRSELLPGPGADEGFLTDIWNNVVQEL